MQFRRFIAVPIRHITRVIAGKCPCCGQNEDKYECNSQPRHSSMWQRVYQCHNHRRCDRFSETSPQPWERVCACPLGAMERRVRPQFRERSSSVYDLIGRSMSCHPNRQRHFGSMPPDLRDPRGDYYCSCQQPCRQHALTARAATETLERSETHR
jgi:hypothetical protein